MNPPLRASNCFTRLPTCARKIRLNSRFGKRDASVSQCGRMCSKHVLRFERAYISSCAVSDFCGSLSLGFVSCTIKTRLGLTDEFNRMHFPHFPRQLVAFLRESFANLHVDGNLTERGLMSTANGEQRSVRIAVIFLHVHLVAFNVTLT